MIADNRNDAGGGQLMSEINVTPLVDVMLVLLIIFMVTAPMMVHGVDVALPETSASAIPADEEDRLIVSIDGDQQLYINDMAIEFAFLSDKLAAIMENRTDRRVFLKADKDIPYGLVVGVMTGIKDAGVEKLGMLTKPAEEKK
ncbi:MAG: protein TolR [Thermodesulfobacteriota bacterium]|nr:protein TolR [Thermodesulfobacteriota bacterium]